jgi:Ser/Thr protein kinase RdoA (MazF antagonist)
VTDDDEAIDVVLARFGVQGAATTPITRGKYNEHWRVEDGPARFVLRRYNTERTAAAVRYEHDVLDRLAHTAWPVAAPLPSVDDDSLVELQGRIFALFPFIDGEPGPAHSRAHLRVKGRLLARLHHDLAPIGPEAQRESFGRIWELDGDDGTFNDLLREFGGTQRELASMIRAHRYRNLRELSRLAYGELPDQLIHGDFTRENLLFDGARLAGVLDFDHAHLDARVVDLAWSVLSDCYEPPEDTAIDAAAAAAYVGGYADHTPLEERELRLVVPLLRAHHLSILKRGLRMWLSEPTDELLFRIDRRVRRRLPQLDERAIAIEQALLAAGQT